jgi:insertion element IS1 protein InsB
MEKNAVWLWRAIDGISRAPLGQHLGTRSDACLRKLVQKIDTGKCSFVTDDWGGFYRVLPEERHFVGKDLTFPIEATNSDIRHRVARFHRRTKVTSRSKEMVDVSLNIFHPLQFEGNLEALIKPLLSFFS